VVLAQPSDTAEGTVEVLVCGATAPAAIAEVSRRFGRIQLTSWRAPTSMPPLPPPTPARAATPRWWRKNSTPTSI
jgi:hypothetical protein